MAGYLPRGNIYHPQSTLNRRCSVSWGGKPNQPGAREINGRDKPTESSLFLWGKPTPGGDDLSAKETALADLRSGRNGSEGHALADLGLTPRRKMATATTIQTMKKGIRLLLHLFY